MSKLWAAAALASPVIWFASHTAQFALSPLACAWNSARVLWLVAGAALLLDAGSGFVAWRLWNRRTEAVMPRWLALSALALSGTFFMVIAAQSIPSLILGGCD